MVPKNFLVNSLGLLALLASCGALLALRGTIFSHQLSIAAPPARPANLTALTVYFHERPPYYFVAGDQVKGLVAERAAAAFRMAGIEFRWVLLPPARQLQRIREAREPCAAIGWFSNEERQGFARFSDSLIQDSPLVALTRIDHSRLKTGVSLGELFQDPGLKLLVKDSYSYGAGLDERIAALGAGRVLTPASNTAMLEMILAGRADLMLLAPEEALQLTSTSASRSAAFRLLEVSGMPAGMTRHMMFSRAVPEELVRKFDHALRQQHPEAKEGVQ